MCVCVCKKGAIKVEIIEMGYQEFAEFQSSVESFELTELDLRSWGLFIVESRAGNIWREGENFGGCKNCLRNGGEFST